VESVAYAVSVALLALSPQVGPVPAKLYGDAIARAAEARGVDPWLLVAIGRIETNWDTDSIGTCCGGAFSIRWPGWRRYARRHGMRTDRRTLIRLARDPIRNIEIAAGALGDLRGTCGPRVLRIVSAYQTGVCRSNAYGRLVVGAARRYRARFASLAPPVSPPRVLGSAVFTFGQRVDPLAMTGATTADGP
jgi:soluble lytic murein transglycosylase-like protein